MQRSQTCRRRVWCGDGEHVFGELEQLDVLLDGGATDASTHDGGSAAVLDDRHELAHVPAKHYCLAHTCPSFCTYLLLNGLY